ncbi:hypothetical protein [Flavobacterium sp.]|jgi:hypothetical protein|uniref:hypothetical protein n=1 Tax=Flavobacterium sp. TaxID=239 RepID=UPI0037BF76B3
MINLEKRSIKEYSVYFGEDKYLGTFKLDVNGEFYFWGVDNYLASCWSSHFLRLIADKLDEVNKPFEKELEMCFRKEDNKLKIEDLNVNF